MYHDESSMKQALCLQIQIMQGSNQLDEFSVICKQNYLWKMDFPEISVVKNSLPSLEKNPNKQNIPHSLKLVDLCEDLSLLSSTRVELQSEEISIFDKWLVCYNW